MLGLQEYLVIYNSTKLYKNYTYIFFECFKVFSLVIFYKCFFMFLGNSTLLTGIKIGNPKI